MAGQQSLHAVIFEVSWPDDTHCLDWSVSQLNLRVWSSIRVVRSRRAQHVLELLELLTLAHRDKDVSGVEPDVCLRVELHRAVLTTHSERDHPVNAPELRFLQRLRGQKASGGDEQLLEREVQVRFAERRREVQKAQDMGTPRE